MKKDYIYYSVFSTLGVSVRFIKRDVSVVRILFRPLIWVVLQIYMREKYSSILKTNLYHILLMIRNKDQNLSA